jgi:hypothetical protein
VLALPAYAGRNQFTTFEGGSMLTTSGTGHALDEIVELGDNWLRVVLYWKQVAPQVNSSVRPAFDARNPNAYPAEGWGVYDQLFADAKQRGMKVLVTISGPVPKWATKTRKDNVNDPNPKEFEQFVTAVGKRYGEQIDSWSIWNEPNHPDFLGPQYRKGKPYSPRLYRKLFTSGVRGLVSSGNSSDLILIGETAPRGTPRVVAPLAFLRGVLCLNERYQRIGGCGKLAGIGGYAHHAYSTRLGPLFKPEEQDDVTIGVLSRLTKALDKAARAGALKRGLGIYLTEFGVQSHPDPFVGVPLDKQAEYRSMSEKIAYDNPRVHSFSQYLMRDDWPRTGNKRERYGGFESGLRYADGRIKPVYEGFRLPLVARRKGAKVKLWGLVRPTKGVTQARILRADKAGSFQLLKTVSTNGRGYWNAGDSYKKGRRWKVEWTSPEGKIYAGPPTRSYDWHSGGR